MAFDSLSIYPFPAVQASHLEQAGAYRTLYVLRDTLLDLANLGSSQRPAIRLVLRHTFGAVEGTMAEGYLVGAGAHNFRHYNAPWGAAEIGTATATAGGAIGAREEIHPCNYWLRAASSEVIDLAVATAANRAAGG